jgi:hypothetical protein
MIYPTGSMRGGLDRNFLVSIPVTAIPAGIETTQRPKGHRRAQLSEKWYGISQKRPSIRWTRGLWLSSESGECNSRNA